MSGKGPQQETLAELDAIFSTPIPKEAMSNHLSLIATGVILALRQVEGDEFMLDYLQAAIDDIEQGNAYAVTRLKTERAH